MEINELDETGRQFMIQLFEQTRGDQAVNVSMYDIGSLLGLERDAASRVAEELMGLQMVEIRTLSGGIGLSTASAEMMQALIGTPADDVSAPVALGPEPLLNSASRQALEEVVADIKAQSGSLGLDYDSLTELMADLKTMDAQLGSSRPKTAIFRECLVSVCGVVKTTANPGLHDRAKRLIGD